MKLNLKQFILPLVTFVTVLSLASPSLALTIIEDYHNYLTDHRYLETEMIQLEKQGVNSKVTVLDSVGAECGTLSVDQCAISMFKEFSENGKPSVVVVSSIKDRRNFMVVSQSLSHTLDSRELIRLATPYFKKGNYEAGL